MVYENENGEYVFVYPEGTIVYQKSDLVEQFESEEEAEIIIRAKGYEFVDFEGIQ